VVGGFDLVVRCVCLDERHVLLDAAGADTGLVAVLGAAEPGRPASVHGTHVDVVAVADDRAGLPRAMSMTMRLADRCLLDLRQQRSHAASSRWSA
jgi:hypothetical protein